ncbi:hypothetical protein GlitD10_1673 [Gloeomargarita lithophora Alchichica-D10]|uniref:Uncharacterized protein n=1 Tax=Gloeomargarita lithophora Alchichica-D10 TaxID=1188229 RepID=A0A1J0ADH5_9CYAN|nr:hypothetical protein [Gloeomargarita lithophora]APB33998.1 hypothetical protein GlitD10_1673 [Gloeomargarita lithophora Alchichica-D10]
MDKFNRYRFVCTLKFGDIYGQVIAWLVVIFLSLAVSLSALATSPIFALAAMGLILVLSLPFLLFAFVTTLFSHVEMYAVESALQTRRVRPTGETPAPTTSEATA